MPVKFGISPRTLSIVRCDVNGPPVINAPRCDHRDADRRGGGLRAARRRAGKMPDQCVLSSPVFSTVSSTINGISAGPYDRHRS